MYANIILFFSLFVITHIVSSHQKENRPLISECEWKRLVLSSKKDCADRCPKYEGFVDPTTNKLICFQKKKPAHSIVSSVQVGDDIISACECGYVTTLSATHESHFLNCQPRKIYQNITDWNECKEACEKISLFLYRDNNDVKLSYCAESSYEILTMKLHSHTVPTYRENGYRKMAYYCQCGIASNYSETRNNDYASALDTGRNIYGSLTDVCKLKEIKTNSKGYCSYRCSKYEGFIDPITNTLICYQKSKPATPILTQFDENNKRLLISCECGHISKSSNGNSYYQHCKPRKIFENITKDECRKTCENLIVYLYPENHKMKISHCEKSDINFASRKLEFSMTAAEKSTKQPEGNNVSFICQCGFGDNNTILTDEIQRNYEEFIASCPAGPFKLSSVNKCKKLCKTTSGFFLPSGDQFICFDQALSAKQISYSGDFCECGAPWITQYDANSTDNLCVPRVIFSELSPDECKKTCDKYTVYSFTKISGKVIHCELSNQLINNIFEGLDWKIGDRESIISIGGKRKHRQFECDCGIKLSLPMDYQLNPDNQNLSTTFGLDWL